MAEVVAEFGVGNIGWTIGRSDGLPDQRNPKNQRKPLDKLMDVSGRPLHVDVDVDGFDDPWVARTRSAGRPVLTQEGVEQVVTYFTLAEYNAFDYMANWVQPLVGSAPERATKLKDPQVRSAMRADTLVMRESGRPEAMRTNCAQCDSDRSRQRA